METYKQTKKLHHLIIRVSKHASSFVYFTFEANEGISFYSTLDESLGTTYRDIEIFTPIELQENLLSQIEALRKIFPIEVLLEEVIVDDRSK